MVCKSKLKFLPCKFFCCFFGFNKALSSRYLVRNKVTRFTVAIVNFICEFLVLILKEAVFFKLEFASSKEMGYDIPGGM